jgi:hypothetical protein
MDNICINPLNNIITITPDNPNWFCNHSGAKIIDYQKKKFICKKCDNKNRVIVKVSQETILSNIRGKTK